ncbi:hypothetical protein HAX54_024879 [Datura stramonium]|uniref:Uncharacterized protein n=1 Tax=Datura stramonium TaxID=4076 RepID=A0ABS8S5N5_DATST|nr:hypothetical protein [Datura stramonium]
MNQCYIFRLRYRYFKTQQRVPIDRDTKWVAARRRRRRNHFLSTQKSEEEEGKVEAEEKQQQQWEQHSSWLFHEQYQSTNRVQLSSLELDSFTETCMLELNPDQAQIRQPALLVISHLPLCLLDLSSENCGLGQVNVVLQSFEAYEDRGAGCFSQEIVLILKSGTPSRDEFWDLYKNYFHQRVLDGALRICLYDEIPAIDRRKKRNKDNKFFRDCYKDSILSTSSPLLDIFVSQICGRGYTEAEFL